MEVKIMSLGNRLFQARKKAGYSQEAVAERLGVSRQTISKWETDETLPDIYQSSRLAEFYHLTLDELVHFDLDIKEIEQVIQNTNEEKESKIDWTNAWSKKYPVLANYQQIVRIETYALQIRKMLNELESMYGFDSLNSMLVLKDILYHEWKDNK